jgi:hypothetical protein
MLDILKAIILDFQEVDLPFGVPRKVEVTSLPGEASCKGPATRTRISALLYPLLYAVR